MHFFFPPLTEKFKFCRWRGENVSTAEVEATVSNFLELQVGLEHFREFPNQ